MAEWIFLWPRRHPQCRGKALKWILMTACRFCSPKSHERNIRWTVGCKALFAGLLAHSLVHAAEPPIQQLKLPPGFKVSLYAYPVPDARSLAQGPGDVVFVGNRAKGS